MPVILERADFGALVENDGATTLLKPAADDVLQRWLVSMRVNSSKAPTEDATLAEEVPA